MRAGALPQLMEVRLAVYDLAGRRLKTLLDGEVPGGVTKVTWDGRDQNGIRISSGVYFIRLKFAKGAQVSKVVMIR